MKQPLTTSALVAITVLGVVAIFVGVLWALVLAPRLAPVVRQWMQ